MQNKLNEFIKYVEKENLNIFGIIIDDNGKEYSHIWNENQTCIYSIGKSITALCIFILEDRGIITLDDKVVSFFPEFEYSEGTQYITIQNLLNMNGRKDVSWIYDESGELPKEDDFLELFLKEKVTLAENEFKYSNLCSYTLGRIVEKVSGHVLLDFANINIFQKLGIISPRWNTCNQGHTICANGLFLNTRELSKIAKMVLNDGYYNGEEIVSSKNLNIDNYVKFKDDTNLYGNGYKNSFWQCPQNAYRMEGIYSNYVIIIKEKNISITITGNERVKRDHKELDFLLTLF